MHSTPFFTTSPTPSPTRPLHVPYTSPTSPTNSLRFQPLWQVEALEAVASALSASSEILIALQGHVSTGLAHGRRECTPTLRTQASHGLACTIEKFYATPSIRGPSRAKKTSPPVSRRQTSPHPLPCKVGYEQSRREDRFTVAKKSFHSCLRQVCHRSQHCKGGAGGRGQ